MVLDLRIPQTKQYEQDVLDTAVAQYLAGELDEAATSRPSPTAGTPSPTRSGDKQLAAYNASLGVQR